MCLTTRAPLGSLTTWRGGRSVRCKGIVFFVCLFVHVLTILRSYCLSSLQRWAMRVRCKSIAFFFVCVCVFFVHVMTILRSSCLSPSEVIGDMSCGGEYCLPFVGGIPRRGWLRGGASLQARTTHHRYAESLNGVGLCTEEGAPFLPM